MTGSPSATRSGWVTAAGVAAIAIPVVILIVVALQDSSVPGDEQPGPGNQDVAGDFEPFRAPEQGRAASLPAPANKPGPLEFIELSGPGRKKPAPPQPVVKPAPKKPTPAKPVVAAYPPVKPPTLLSQAEFLSRLEKDSAEVDLYKPNAKAARSFKEITTRMKVAERNAENQRKTNRRVDAFKRLNAALQGSVPNQANDGHRTERLEVISPDGIIKSFRMLPPASVARAQYENNKVFDPIKKWLPNRADLKGLPLKDSDSVRLDFEAADALRKNSTTFVAFRAFPHTGENVTIQHLGEKKWTSADIPSLTQMLQAGPEKVRLKYVSVLEDIDSTASTDALVKRALFDPSETVRGKAIDALKTRPVKDVQPKLLKGFRYPWQPVVDRAADALVKMDDKSSIDKLRDLLNERDPAAPVQHPNGKWHVKELTRVNHLRNCYLCHAPSLVKTDLVRGLVPDPYQPLPREYYQSRSGSFVRADVTYLKQDFSVVHTVKNPKPWTEKQRFDYFVRTREIPEKEARQLLAARTDADYKRAVQYALHRLTN